MEDLLQELYQDLILDHGKSPRNQGTIADCIHNAKGHNPLCGDEVELFLSLNQVEEITEVKFIGHGCAISMASASLMTELLKGKTVQEAHGLFSQFHHMIMDEKDMEPSETLGKLVALAGVKHYPMRVKCATLAWHTLEAALDQKQQPISTE